LSSVLLPISRRASRGDAADGQRLPSPAPSLPCISQRSLRHCNWLGGTAQFGRPTNSRPAHATPPAPDLEAPARRKS
jgi:hypothetical protein